MSAHNVVKEHVFTSAKGNREGLLAVLCQLAWMIGLASLAVVAVTGQFPWFLLSLGVVLFFSSCMPLRQIRQKTRSSS